MLVDFRLSTRAILAEFIRPSIFTTGVVLCAVAWFVSDLFPTANWTQMGVGSGLVTLFYCRTLHDGWLRDARLHALSVYPLRTYPLALSALLVALVCYVIETLIPMGLFFALLGSGHLVEYVCLILFNLGLALLILTLAQSRLRAPILSAYALGLLAVAGSYYSILIAAGASLALSAGVLLRGLRLVPALQRGRGARIRLGRSNYFLVHALSDRRVWSTLFIATLFAGILSWNQASQGLSPLLWVALVTVNTAQTTVLSRDPDTAMFIQAVGDQRRSAFDYWLATCVIFLLGASVQVAIGAYFGVSGWGGALVALAVCVGAAGLSTWLDFAHPLEGIKSERDAFRNPRKYITPVAAAVVLVGFELLSTAV